MNDTIRAYDEHAATWAAARTGPSYWEHARKLLEARLPGGSRLIEFGCGTGWDGAELAKTFDYTGLDGSEGMLKLARIRLPGSRLWCMDFMSMQLPYGEEPFDGFWSVAALPHIPAGNLHEALGNMAKMLKPGAIGFIAVKDGDGTEEVTVPEVPSPRFFQFWSRRGFEAELTVAGYGILGYELRPAREDKWHQFIVQLNG